MGLGPIPLPQRELVFGVLKSMLFSLWVFRGALHMQQGPVANVTN